MFAIIHWAFERVDAPHLGTLTDKSDIGSWKPMEKLGMERRRDLEFDDPDFPARNNHIIPYSLTGQQWEMHR